MGVWAELSQDSGPLIIGPKTAIKNRRLVDSCSNSIDTIKQDKTIPTRIQSILGSKVRQDHPDIHIGVTVFYKKRQHPINRV